MSDTGGETRSIPIKRDDYPCIPESAWEGISKTASHCGLEMAMREVLRQLNEMYRLMVVGNGR